MHAHQPLHTVLLHHQLARASHHDWLMESPDPTQKLLTCFRVTERSLFHHPGSSTLLTALPPHRRAYLNYQGPVTPLLLHNRIIDRGRVVRVQSGIVRPLVWTDRLILLDVRWPGQAGLIRLQKASADRWRAVHLP